MEHLLFYLAAVISLSVLGQGEATTSQYSLPPEIVYIACKPNCIIDDPAVEGHSPILQVLIDQLCEQARMNGEIDEDDSGDCVPPVMPLLTDCSQILRHLKSNGANRIPSGRWRIKPDNMETSVEVSCEMAADGGGWTVLQNRFDGSVNFYRRMPDYRYGFGDISGEHWLGLDVLHRLTGGKTAYELRVELEDWDGNRTWAKYSEFKVAGEREKYKLTVDGYQGNASDSFVSSSRNTCTFRTRQEGHHSSSRQRSDNSFRSRNCAEKDGGGWWYCDQHHNYCKGSRSNLNGPYFKFTDQYDEERTGRGVYWRGWRRGYSLKATRMMIRPNNFLHQLTK